MKGNRNQNQIVIWDNVIKHEKLQRVQNGMILTATYRNSVVNSITEKFKAVINTQSLKFKIQ